MPRDEDRQPVAAAGMAPGVPFEDGLQVPMQARLIASLNFPSRHESKQPGDDDCLERPIRRDVLPRITFPQMPKHLFGCHGPREVVGEERVDQAVRRAIAVRRPRGEEDLRPDRSR